MHIKLTRFQGLKLRDIADVLEEGPQRRWKLSWPSPGITDPVIDLRTRMIARQGPQALRMTFFRCNEDNIIGYSVCSAGMGVLYIHTHFKGETDLEFYNAFENRPNSGTLVWLYMPIAKGELLTEIGTRSFGIPGPPHSLGGLTVSSSWQLTITSYVLIYLSSPQVADETCSSPNMKPLISN